MEPKFKTDLSVFSVRRLAAQALLIAWIIPAHNPVLAQGAGDLTFATPKREHIYVGGRQIAEENNRMDANQYPSGWPDKSSISVWTTGWYDSPLVSAGYTSAIAELVHADVAVTSVKLIDCITSAVIASLSKDVEAVSTGAVRASIWSVHNLTSTGCHNLQVTFAAKCSAKVVDGFMVRGLQSAPLDRTSAAIGNSTSPSSGATTVTSVDREIVIGLVGLNGPYTDPVGSWSTTSSPGFNGLFIIGTQGQGAASNVTLHYGWRTVSGPGAFTAAKTGTASRKWAAVAATYKGQ